MAEVIREQAFSRLNEIWGSEVALFMPRLYAGTSDLVALYDDRPAICDFKQTNRPKKEEYVEDYYLQLVAYAEAHNEIYDTNICEGHIFMCSRDFEYQQFDITPETYPHWRNKWYDRVYTYYEQGY